MKKGVDAEKSIVDNKHMKTESIEVAVQMSTFRSGHARKEGKGNHRRVDLPAGMDHGVTGNTCNTPA